MTAYKKQVLKEQDGKCALCGIDTWQGKPLTLELDHIDGNNQNNKRSNQRCLCPNCHSQTPNWRGRNSTGTHEKKISDEKLLKALKKTASIKAALRQVGYNSSAHNYARCRKLLGLPIETKPFSYNWEQIQEDHNNGMTWVELKLLHGVSFTTLNKATKSGKFISRTRAKS